jgi:outer membrane protein
MIKRYFYFLFFILIGFNSYAETTVNFVDIKFLIDQSNSGKKINELLIDLRKKETSKLKKMQTNLKKQESEIKSKNNILSKEELEKNITKLKTNINDYNNLKNKKEIEFNKKKTEYMNKLLLEINKIMISYIDKNSIDIVIKKENLVTGKKELDITKYILDELNKKKINF